MRLAHHLLRHPSGTWHFRLIVPKSVRPILGLSVIKRSLGTKDPVVARAWAYALGARCAQMLSTARDAMEAGMSKGDDDAVARAVGQIQRNVGSGSIRPWEVETPNGYRIRTDGSDKDNKDGLAALKAILESRPDVPPNPAPWVAPVSARVSCSVRVPIEVRMPKHVPKLTSVHKHEQQALCSLLRELRLATGLRQDQVAEQMGTSQTTISEIELGQRGVDLLVCRRLVGVYGADWESFIAELERRLMAGTTPAAPLIRRGRLKSGQ
ncbi:DUF6538 domain-containing protein [Luteibacter jiangsuensis]